MPKVWLLVLPVLLLASPALAGDRVGYVNVARVLAESDAGKQASAELAQAEAPLVRERDAAAAEAEKAEASKAAPSVVKAKRDHALQLERQRDAEMQRRNADAVAKLKARIAAVAAKLATERKLTEVFDGAPLFARFDLTADVLKRLNAETPVAVAADVVKAKDAEIALLKAKLEAAKPAATAQAANTKPNR